MPIELSALATHFGRGQNPAPPRHLGTRYDRAGAFQPEAGNTVVCHVEEGSATQQALVDARRQFATMADAANLALTPVASYHMTLFQGIIEARRAYPYWPRDIAGDMPILAMTEQFMQRLQGFAGGPGFQVAVTAMVPTGLRVEGITPADRQAMASWRNQFADLLGYRHPDHDSYEFHITMAYLIDWLDEASLPGWKAMLDAVEADIVQRAPVLELRAPAFCSFSDMNWFEELLVFEPR
ncbi:MAG: DUF1868 domain-containing protein [Devosia sp.]